MTATVSSVRPTAVDEAAREGPVAPRARAFRVLFAGLVCVGIGHSIVFSILPPLARELGIAEVAVGTVFTVSAALWVLASPLWGRLSDTSGRRRVILVGLLGYSASTWAFAATVQAGLSALIPAALVFPLLVASRALFGAIGSGIFPAAQAYVADRTAPGERVAGVATVGAAMGLGTALGPALGALLVGFGLLAPLYAVAGIAVASTLGVWWWLPAGSHRPTPGAAGRMSPREPAVRPYLLIGLAMSTAQAILMQTIGFHFMDSLALDAGAAAKTAGLGLSVFAAASLAAQLGIMRVVRPAATTLLRAGGLLGVAACALLVAPASLASLTGAMAIAGLALGCLRPGNLAAASLSVGGDRQGAVAGLVGATVAAGWIVAPVVGTGLYSVAPLAPYVLGAALMGFVAVMTVAEPRVRALRARGG